MDANALSNEIKRSIWERQNGMCALTGKKFEEFNETIEVDFLFIKPLHENGTEDNENIVMLWKRHSGIPKGKIRKYIFPYANFTAYDANSKAAEIKEEIDEAVSLSTSTNDWKKIRNLIREVTSSLQALNIPISQKNEFKELLLNALNAVNTRQTEEFEKNKSEWNINFDRLKTLTSEAVEFADNAKIFKEAREKLIAAQNEMKKFKISREHRDELGKMLSTAFTKLNEKEREYRENFEMECIENFHKLKDIVADAIQKANVAETFAVARNILVGVQNELKDKTLKRDQKDGFFINIREVFESLQEKFPESKRVTDEEAAENYAILRPKVDEAIEFAKNAAMEQAQEAREKLIAVQNTIKEHRIHKAQKDELFAIIREVFEKVNERTNEEREQFEAESNSNYEKLLSKVELVIVDIEHAIDFRNSADNLTAIKTELQLCKLKKDQRNKLFEKTRLAFNLLFKKRDEYNKRKAMEKISKLESTCVNLQQKIDRLVELLVKDRELLANQNTKLEAAKEDEQAKTNISKVIDTINSRIKDRENSMKATNSRIEDIKKEIDKIRNKILHAKSKKSADEAATTSSTSSGNENSANENVVHSEEVVHTEENHNSNENHREEENHNNEENRNEETQN